MKLNVSRKKPCVNQALGEKMCCDVIKVVMQSFFGQTYKFGWRLKVIYKKNVMQPIFATNLSCAFNRLRP